MRGASHFPDDFKIGPSRVVARDGIGNAAGQVAIVGTAPSGLFVYPTGGAAAMANYAAATGNAATLALRVVEVYDKPSSSNADVTGAACTFDLYRVSSDIAPQFYSTVWNLQHVVPFNRLADPLSRPGCFAYPDMSQVARLASVAEDQAHFAAWSIVSSPQVLGFDLTDTAAFLFRAR